MNENKDELRRQRVLSLIEHGYGDAVLEKAYRKRKMIRLGLMALAAVVLIEMPQPVKWSWADVTGSAGPVGKEADCADPGARRPDA